MKNLKFWKSPGISNLYLAGHPDLAGAGKLKNLHVWWGNITEIAPLLGYFPRPDKSWLIVKQELFQSAVTAFTGTGLQISIDRHSYLGGYIGTSTSEEEHITSKVRKLVEQIEKFSSIAKMSGFRHRFTYSIRTTPNIQNLLRPLDNVIETKLIPAFTDNKINFDKIQERYEHYIFQTVF